MARRNGRVTVWDTPRYSARAGAYSAEAAREIDARRQAEPHWPTDLDRAIDPWDGRETQP